MGTAEFLGIFAKKQNYVTTKEAIIMTAHLRSHRHRDRGLIIDGPSLPSAVLQSAPCPTEDRALLLILNKLKFHHRL